MNNNLYQVSAPLVHKLIGSIIAAILAIGGYMIMWAVNDAAFKQEVRTTLLSIERHIVIFEEHMEQPCHREACERFDQIEKHPHHKRIPPHDIGGINGSM